MKYAYFNPTVFAIEDIPENTFSDLRNIVYTAHTYTNLNDEGNPNISIRGGQQIQLLPNEIGLDIGVLKIFVEDRCKEYMKTIISAAGKDDLPYEPMLVSAWTIQQSQGDYQALHTHEAHISGNIYIDVPDLVSDSRSSDSCLEFRLPVIKNTGQFIFTDQWRFTPQAAKMVVFPSYIPHTVYPWKGNGTRTILAWDVKLMPKRH